MAKLKTLGVRAAVLEKIQAWRKHHVINMTMTAARDMLESGDLPIRLIADMLGFSSAAYFTRFIQNQTNQTPSALRQKALNVGSKVVLTGLRSAAGQQLNRQ